MACYMHTSNSWLLFAECQIDTLIFDLSFGHNLCFKYPSESCEPILKIYVPRAFQWYKELFNPMNFDRYELLLKIWKSIRIPIPKMGVHLGVWGFIPSHFPTFSYTPGNMKCDSRASLLARTFVNYCFGHKLKIKVLTWRPPLKFKRLKKIVHIHAISVVNGHKMKNCPKFT